jgi:hypothetical protein
VTVLTAIALIMTVGVYGLVAGIVKLDDFGLYLHQRRGKLQQRLGKFLLLASPWLMKALSFLGTAAMFMVGGGILTHGWHTLHELSESLAHQVGAIGGIGFLLKAIVPILFDVLVGIVVGAVVLAVVTLVQRVLKKEKVHA